MYCSADVAPNSVSICVWLIFTNLVYPIYIIYIYIYTLICVHAMEAIALFAIKAKRFSYPVRYTDMVPVFGRPDAQLSLITTEIMNLIYTV